VRRSALLLLLCVGCMRGAKKNGTLELFAASGVPPDVRASLMSDVEKLTHAGSVEDVTPAWESLTIGTEELRFRTFTEAPPPQWPKELEKPWKEALAACAKRFPDKPELGNRLELITCNVELVEVLWNQYLAFKHAAGSTSVFWKDFKQGQYEVFVERVVAGSPVSCERDESPNAADAKKMAETLVKACITEKSIRPRLADTKMAEVAPAPGSVVPPPKAHPPLNPKLETKITSAQMPPLDLGPACSRPGHLNIDSWVAPSMSRLLEQRWLLGSIGIAGEISCELKGNYEVRPGASVLPLTVNSYELKCGEHTVKASAVTQDEQWPEHVSRRLLQALVADLCPPAAH
jgi:hypothetical protein